MKFNFDPKTIFLIDGSSFLYRAYYSMKPLHSPEGEPVQAVYGFCRMIKKVMDQFEPKNMALVWDSKGKTLRHDLFEDYKATRQSAPSDLGEQKEKIKEFAKLIGLEQVEKSGVEADDLIYSIAKDFQKTNNIVIISSDKDLYQLLDKNVSVFDPFKDELITIEKHEEKLGYSIEKIPFYFSILGDSSDNIPGVKGIGQKGAQELVKEFNSLDDLYNNLDKVKKDRTRNALIENKENAFLSLKLFTLIYQSTGIISEKLEFNVKNWSNANSLFEKLNFKSLLQKKEENLSIFSTPEEKIHLSKKRNFVFKCVKTKSELQDLANYLSEKKEFAIDTETTGLSPLQDELVGISICAEKGLSFYIPIICKDDGSELKKSDVIEIIGPILESSDFKKIMHNAKFDILSLYNAGIKIKGLSFDTIIAANLISKEWQRINLAQLSKDYLDDEMLSFDEVVKKNKHKDFSYVPLDLATEYAAADAHQTFCLKEIFKERLKKENLLKIFYELEMPLVEVLTDIEKNGIYLETDSLQSLEEEISKELSLIEEKIESFLDEENKINLNSPKQVEELLFKKLNLPKQKKSSKKTGFSTDQEVLKTLSEIHPIPGLILKHRELYKLKSTYVSSLPNYVNPKDNKIHTNFSQTVTSTGRLASSDPNLQNIPADNSTYAQELRKAFKPNKGEVFISADYSQIELRVLAYLSKDKNLEKSFLQDLDIHSITAANIFECEINQVTKEQRQVGKRINFSILYGLTPFGLSKDLNIPFSDAKKYIEKYFMQFPQVSEWMDSIVEKTKETGFVETLWGKRRYIPGIYETNKHLYDFAKRAAINTVAQGTAAEIMKNGMIKISKEIPNAKIILQIHDELLISAPEELSDKMELEIKEKLEKIVDWNIPLKVATRSGKNWFDVSK